MCGCWWLSLDRIAANLSVSLTSQWMWRIRRIRYWIQSAASQVLRHRIQTSMYMCICLHYSISQASPPRRRREHRRTKQRLIGWATNPLIGIPLQSKADHAPTNLFYHTKHSVCSQPLTVKVYARQKSAISGAYQSTSCRSHVISHNTCFACIS